jgi:membrane protein implicated in regulation of membrane protease activity
MEFDNLIEPPHYAKSEGETAVAVFWVVFLSIWAVISAGLGGLLLSFANDNFPEFYTYGGGLLALAVLCLVLIRVAGKKVRKQKEELNRKTGEYYQRERARLEALKASMTTVEWENYKLQLQNQQLLKQINSKQVRGSTGTTTTTSFTTEI